MNICALQGQTKEEEEKKKTFFRSMINRTFPHCFLLDGKILLPLNGQVQSMNDETNLNFNTCLASSKILSRDFSSEKSYQSPWAITINIKPFISSEDHRKDTSHEKKRKNSSSSVSNPFKRTSLSTFKDQKHRSIPATINFLQTPVLHSRTLLNLYRTRKNIDDKLRSFD